MLPCWYANWDVIACLETKQWPLAPNSRDSLITRANVSRRVTFFSKMAFGECWQVWRVRATRLGECWLVWGVLSKPLDECWLKQDRSFYAKITFFICIKRSSLHSLNLPNSPNSLNSRKTCQTCLSRVWRVRATWLGKCWRVLKFAKFAGEWPFRT